jgi:Cu/Ag efflux protein CusF
MRFIFALIFLFSLPAFAQHDPSAHSQATAQPAALSDGVVKKIDKAAGEIVIQHGQLDSIAMPPMTMAFGVADKTWLNKLKAGDKIRFSAELKNGSPSVNRYEIAK